MKKKISIILLSLLSYGCTSSSNNMTVIESPVIDPTPTIISDTQERQTLVITSQDLVNGVWNREISKSNGLNRCPQLSFNEIDGAVEYAIFMIDNTANNWMHWRLTGLTATTIDSSESIGEYVGPYPPSGTHTYTIYVYALSVPCENPNIGNMDNANESDLSFIEQSLGHVICMGSISGTYSAQ